jgi:hypothetical protein
MNEGNTTMKNNSASKAVAKAPEAQLPAEVDYGEYAGAGFEGQSREDYSIPFIAVLQSNSPQCTDEGSEARPGMLINTVTGDTFKGSEGVEFIPAYTDHVYVEWRPRDAGGGIVNQHLVSSDAAQEARAAMRVGKYKNAAGNEMVETFYVYGVLVKSDGNTEPAALAFSSTKIKPYRGWMTKANTFTPMIGGKKVRVPLFGARYRLTTVKQKNTKGEFFNWQVAFAGGDGVKSMLAPNDNLFQEARSLYESVKSGALKANVESQAAASGGAPSEDIGEEAPF